MPGTSGTSQAELGGVGERDHLDHRLGAVDELHEHARVHVAPRRFLGVRIGCRVHLERIVLALAGCDDGVAQAAHEIHELHGRARLVTGPQRVDHAGRGRARGKVSADGDVGFDVHHDHVLARVDGGKRDLRADVRIAGGVDDDVDVAGGADVAVRRRNREPASGHRRVDAGCIVDGLRHARAVTGDLAGGQHDVRIRVGRCSDLDARHVGGLHQDVRAHLPRPDEADAHRPAGAAARVERFGEGAAGRGQGGRRHGGSLARANNCMIA